MPLQLSGDPENPLIPRPLPSEDRSTKWLDETLNKIREKEAVEAAISNWLKENPQATAAQYIEQVKKNSEANERTADSSCRGGAI